MVNDNVVQRTTLRNKGQTSWPTFIYSCSKDKHTTELACGSKDKHLMPSASYTKANPFIWK